MDNSAVNSNQKNIKSVTMDMGRMRIRKQRRKLPIYSVKNELMQFIQDNKICIIIGETGSGKSTQLTQYLLESKYFSQARICCTQPRIVAAVSLAQRVAKEQDCNLGSTVGYTVRFDSCTSKNTKIHYMTDGVLVRKCLDDPDLLEYSVIILDEAHERSVHTDVLFGLLKLLTQRRNFKLIITSATLDAMKFSEFFFNAPIFKVSGRLFPVEIEYLQEPNDNYKQLSVNVIMKIHSSKAPGDILVFLPGEMEINEVLNNLKETIKNSKVDIDEFLILQMFSLLPEDQKKLVFQPTPAGKRKIILATNIAETSITIDEIAYVIDSGVFKQLVYDPKKNLNSLILINESQAQANQRSGRCGRVGPGKCYRLFTKEQFDQMEPNTIPQITRTNIILEILHLKVFGYSDIYNFGFMNAPPRSIIDAGLNELEMLSALNAEKEITAFGKNMALFPISPHLSKALLHSFDLHCSEEMIIIISCMTVGLIKGNKKIELENLQCPEGDPLTYLKIFKAWKKLSCDGEESSDEVYKWGEKNDINVDNLMTANKIAKQLNHVMDRHNFPIISCGNKFKKIGRALFTGLFMNIARRNGSKSTYKVLRSNEIADIHQSSVLFKEKPEWIVYNTKIQTNRKTCLHDVMVCNMKWFEYCEISAEDVITSGKNFCDILTAIGRHFSFHVMSNSDFFYK